jgi:hypothetical protein
LESNYAKLVQDNIKRIFQQRSLEDLARCLPGVQEDNGVSFPAFGGKCRISPEGVFLNGNPEQGVPGILVSLYGLNAGPETCVLHPFRAFKDFPNSGPYAGAFASHTQNILIPHAEKIEAKTGAIRQALNGQNAPGDTGGDFSFVIFPLPKIALCYIFYLADEDFPASVTCLYSHNALSFIPIDGMADVGEYSSKKILQLL